MIQADHHPNWPFGRHEGILGPVNGVQGGLLLRGESFVILGEGPVVENMVGPAETVSSGYSADEPAVRHVSEG